MACTDTNAIQFNFSKQCVEPVGGTLKSIYLESADGKDERYWKAMYDLERLSLDHLKPDMLYRVRSSGGDQGALYNLVADRWTRKGCSGSKV